MLGTDDSEPKTGWTATTEPARLAALADGSAMSASHFLRSFPEAFGETPDVYVTRRIERAKALLRCGVCGSKITVERDFALPRLAVSCRRGWWRLVSPEAGRARCIYYVDTATRGRYDSVILGL